MKPSMPGPKRVPKRLRRGAYLLPSLFTIGNIMLGFYALVRGFRGDFHQAAVCIFVAAVLDALDGRIARLTGTESEFGKEFDSLADVLTFGLTPAFLTFLWGLEQLGRIGWLVPLFYVLCTATRLARFNIKTSVQDSRSFVGLPSPAAAMAIAAILLYAPDSSAAPWLEKAMIAALLSVGVLMVSTFRYPSFKRIDLRQRWSYRAALGLAGFILIMAYRPLAFFVAVATVFPLLGPLSWLWSRVRRVDPDAESATDPQDAQT